MVIYIDDNGKVVKDKGDCYLILKMVGGSLTVELWDSDIVGAKTKPYLVLDAGTVDQIHKLFINIDLARSAEETEEVFIVIKPTVELPFSKRGLKQTFKISANKGKISGFIFDLVLEAQIEGGGVKTEPVFLYIINKKTITAIQTLLTID